MALSTRAYCRVHLLWWLCIWGHWLLVLAIPEGSFYDIGSGEMELLPDDDAQSEPIILDDPPFSFYGVENTMLFVSTNGLISIRKREDNFIPRPLPTNGTFIAPFWGDADTRGGRGRVIYGVTRNERALMRARDEIRSVFANMTAFTPSYLFIATWERVGFYLQRRNNLLRNTFQCILLTDGIRTFVIFQYPENGLNWSAGNSHGRNGFFDPMKTDDNGVQLPAAIAGFNFNDTSSNITRFEQLPGSGTDAVTDLTTISNIGKAGVWIFQVDEPEIISPELVTSAPITTATTSLTATTILTNTTSSDLPLTIIPTSTPTTILMTGAFTPSPGLPSTISSSSSTPAPAVSATTATVMTTEAAAIPTPSPTPAASAMSATVMMTGAAAVPTPSPDLPSTINPASTAIMMTTGAAAIPTPPPSTPAPAASVTAATVMTTAVSTPSLSPAPAVSATTAATLITGVVAVLTPSLSPAPAASTTTATALTTGQSTPSSTISPASTPTPAVSASNRIPPAATPTPNVATPILSQATTPAFVTSKPTQQNNATSDPLRSGTPTTLIVIIVGCIVALGIAVVLPGVICGYVLVFKQFSGLSGSLQRIKDLPMSSLSASEPSTNEFPDDSFKEKSTQELHTAHQPVVTVLSPTLEVAV